MDASRCDYTGKRRGGAGYEIFMKPEYATLIRAILKVGGTALTSKGLVDDGTIETAIGAIITLWGIVWGIMEAKKQKEKNETSPKL